MRYKHDTLLPMGAFKRQGSVVGGRSMRVHGGDSWGQYWEDPRFDSSQGSYVTIDSDAGGVWQPITVGAPVGQYVTTNADAGGEWVENTPAQQASMNAQLEAARQSDIQAAAAYVAANPLAISGNQINTPFGSRDISMFKPILQPGQTATGSTPTQLIDPGTGMPVFLSNPNDPYSFTYNVTDTPALGGTLEQQAAMYVPTESRGVFGTIGRDFLEGVKDPYFRNFAIAAAAMAAAAALAPAAAGSVGTTAGGSGAVAYPINFGNTILTGGELAGTGGAGFLGGAGEILPGAVGTGGGSLGGTGIVGSTAGGFLGGAGEILPGAVGTGGGSLGAGGFGSALAGLGPAASAAAPSASTLAQMFQKGADVLAGPYGSLIKGGLTLGGLAAASALKPKTDTSGAGGAGMTPDELNAIVALMPSMVGQYTSQAGQGTGLPTGGYNPGTGSSLANLFPGFSLPTQGPFYGAGRFGENYNPAPVTSLV